jgi:ketosteroid isomerase-like protein
MLVGRAGQDRPYATMEPTRGLPARCRMSPSDLAQFIEQYHQSIDAIVRGDPEPQMRLWSRGDDVTLANPLGPPVLGWDRVKEHLERAAASAREGEPLSYEPIAEYATAELGYNVELERTRAKFDGADELTPISLRVTTIFRREDGEWRIVHRHADALTGPRSAASVAEQS